MPRLTRRLGPDSERGAVAATVAVVLGAGVLLGMATVVVDVGRLYAEREQLQSGADAAAWAVAEGCVRTPDDCADQVAEAGRYADDNAADGAAAITEICGSGPGLDECSATADNNTACLGDPPADVTYVEVRTTTRLPDGSTLLPPAFAGALAGDAYTGTEVGACARAAWGAPATAHGFAVTISTCEWNSFTSGGDTFWPTPDHGIPPGAAERVVYLHSTGGATTCPAGPSGWDRPGGFGWLDDPDRVCETTVAYDGTFGGDTGDAVSHPCRDALSAARTNRTVALIPIYDGVRGTGTGTTYHLAGFASFVVTGYHLPGFVQPSWLTGRAACTGSRSCLSGYFTRGVVSAVGEFGGPNLGLSVVTLVG